MQVNPSQIAFFPPSGFDKEPRLCYDSFVRTGKFPKADRRDAVLKKGDERMKKLFTLALAMCLALSMAVPTMAETEQKIIYQMSNEPQYMDPTLNEFEKAPRST